jgi:D-aminoacyl-tRNA deacylase
VRALIQRVKRAEVICSSGKRAAIGRGHLLLVGVGREDGPEDAAWLARRIPRLRLFPDAHGLKNLSLLEMNDPAAGVHADGPPGMPGAILLISNFTLFADTARGRRPHYGRAADPEQAVPLCEALVAGLRAEGLPVETGVFGDSMQIELVADGPVTIWLDTKER